ncbi:hypothetical protein [Nonomuraea sp. NPDC049400]|uniref:hypothetical protein n=1 Tax=Nonomuraea sp. NPDC049400 TaxID=3364352 RepID=UPI0037A8DF72
MDLVDADLVTHFNPPDHEQPLCSDTPHGGWTDNSTALLGYIEDQALLEREPSERRVGATGQRPAYGLAYPDGIGDHRKHNPPYCGRLPVYRLGIDWGYLRGQHVTLVGPTYNITGYVLPDQLAPEPPRLPPVPAAAPTDPATRARWPRSTRAAGWMSTRHRLAGFPSSRGSGAGERGISEHNGSQRRRLRLRIGEVPASRSRGPSCG